jgi:GTP cyclohydrolase IV
MSERFPLLEPDLQATAPEVPIGLSRAGVTGLSKAIRIRYGEREKLIAADIECTVDLDPGQKGVHMSRFPELFEEAIEEVVIGEAFLVEVLAEHIARHILERQQALRAEVRIDACVPVRRRRFSVVGAATFKLALACVARAERRQGTTRVRSRRRCCALPRPALVAP